MGQYIYTVAVGAIFSAVIVFFCPGGEGGKFSKYVAFAGALTLLIVMLSPIPGFFEKEHAEWNADTSKAESSNENKAEYYANSAGMALSEIYGTPLSDITASVIISDDGELKKIELHIKGDPVYSIKEAGSALSDILGVETEVREGD